MKGSAGWPAKDCPYPVEHCYNTQHCGTQSAPQTCHEGLSISNLPRTLEILYNLRLPVHTGTPNLKYMFKNNRVAFSLPSGFSSDEPILSACRKRTALL